MKGKIKDCFKDNTARKVQLLMSTQMEMEETWFEWNQFWKYPLNNFVCNLHAQWEWQTAKSKVSDRMQNNNNTTTNNKNSIEHSMAETWWTITVFRGFPSL